MKRLLLCSLLCAGCFGGGVDLQNSAQYAAEIRPALDSMPMVMQHWRADLAAGKDEKQVWKDLGYAMFNEFLLLWARTQAAVAASKPTSQPAR